MIRYRALTKKDLAEIEALERECFSDPWTKSMFLGSFLSEFFCGIGAFDGEKAVGFALATVVFEDVETDDIAVSPEYRRCGIGGQLLKAVEGEARARGAIRAFLEVRVSNLPAMALYEKCGYKAIRRRGRVRDDETPERRRCRARGYGRERKRTGLKKGNAVERGFEKSCFLTGGKRQGSRSFARIPFVERGVFASDRLFFGIVPRDGDRFLRLRGERSVAVRVFRFGLRRVDGKRILFTRTESSFMYRPFFRLPRGGEDERAGGGNGGGNKDTAAIFRRIR